MRMVGLERQFNEIGFIKKVAKARGWRIEEKDSLNFTIWINNTDCIKRNEFPTPRGSSTRWMIQKTDYLKTCGFDEILGELNGLMNN